MNDLKSKIEAVLFSSGRKMNTEEIAKLCHSTIKQVETALAQLSDEYDQNKNSLMIVNEKQDWKLTVHEKYLNVVRKIVPETELTKTIMETLAVVAWKSPVLQSEVIKIRTNKAYDHLDQLEEMAFIFRKKEGRTKNILLTEKFYKYFDLDNKEDIKNVFKDFKEKAYQENKERQLMNIEPEIPINLPENKSP